MFASHKIHDVRIGEVVLVDVGVGVVRYVGKVEWASPPNQTWIGLELTEADNSEFGRNDGKPSFAVRRYFQCPPNLGFFTRSTNVKRKIAPAELLTKVVHLNGRIGNLSETVKQRNGTIVNIRQMIENLKRENNSLKDRIRVLSSPDGARLPPYLGPHLGMRKQSDLSVTTTASDVTELTQYTQQNYSPVKRKVSDWSRRSIPASNGGYLFCLTGLPGVGKLTVAKAILDKMRPSQHKFRLYDYQLEAMPTYCKSKLHSRQPLTLEDRTAMAQQAIRDISKDLRRNVNVLGPFLILQHVHRKMIYDSIANICFIDLYAPYNVLMKRLREKNNDNPLPPDFFKKLVNANEPYAKGFPVIEVNADRSIREVVDSVLSIMASRMGLELSEFLGDIPPSATATPLAAGRSTFAWRDTPSSPTAQGPNRSPRFKKALRQAELEAYSKRKTPSPRKTAAFNFVNYDTNLIFFVLLPGTSPESDRSKNLMISAYKSLGELTKKSFQLYLQPLNRLPALSQPNSVRDAYWAQNASVLKNLWNTSNIFAPITIRSQRSREFLRSRFGDAAVWIDLTGSPTEAKKNSNLMDPIQPNWAKFRLDPKEEGETNTVKKVQAFIQMQLSSRANSVLKPPDLVTNPKASSPRSIIRVAQIGSSYARARLAATGALAAGLDANPNGPMPQSRLGQRKLMSLAGPGADNDSSSDDSDDNRPISEFRVLDEIEKIKQSGYTGPRVFALVGLPGAGKTSVMRQVVKALNDGKKGNEATFVPYEFLDDAPSFVQRKRKIKRLLVESDYQATLPPAVKRLKALQNNRKHVVGAFNLPTLKLVNKLLDEVDGLTIINLRIPQKTCIDRMILHGSDRGNIWKSLTAYKTLPLSVLRIDVDASKPLSEVVKTVKQNILTLLE